MTYDPYMTKTRRCARCKEDKELECFSRDRGNNSGLQANCKVCATILTREYYERHPGKKLEVQLKFLRENERSRNNAAHHRQPWSQSEDEFLAAFYPENQNRVLAESMGRTIASIKRRAQILELHKRPTDVARDVTPITSYYV